MTTPLKKTVLGVHDVVIRDYSTQENPLMLKVVDGVKLDLAEKVVMAKGGEARDAYAAAIVDSNGKITVTVKELSNALLSNLFHNTATEGGADSAPVISALSNVVGTSCYNTTTGIQAVAADTGTPKEGVYRVVAVSGTTVNVYASTDIDGVTLSDETTGLVNATPLTITSGAYTDVSAIGVKLEGGSGTIGLTIGDSFSFSVVRANVGTIDVNIGLENNKSYKEVFLVFGENTERDFAYMRFYKCVVSRSAINIAVKDYHSFELEITPIKDPLNSGYIGIFHRTDNV